MKNLGKTYAFLFLIAVLVFISVCTVSCAVEGTQAERTVSVTGNSTVYAVPDQALISFSVNSKNKNLSAAKAKNDEIIKKVNEIFAKHNVEQKDITLERITIYPRYLYGRNDEATFSHYEAEQKISVMITDIDRYEVFLTDILNAGIYSINGISFSVKNIRKYKDEARTAAVKAAEEKAELLCAAASKNGNSVKLGTVISISEIPRNSYGGSGLSSQNSILLAFAEKEDSGAIPPIGQVQLTAEVEMVFKIER